ncbi:MAG: B12-binding domain-containing protein [Nitrosopumilus sp.]|nr:B12-binding domain-containing protein [Nitrosopumilus sp.]
MLKIEKSKKQVLTGLKNGKVDEIIKIAKKYKAQKSLGKFYDDVLKNAMYEVGYLWQQNKLDVGMEHICSNTAIKAIDKITEPYKKPSGAYRIVLCTPHGELHNISCSVYHLTYVPKPSLVNNSSCSDQTFLS